MISRKHNATTGQKATGGNDRIYQDVTRRILDKMMQGEIPWRQTWVPDKEGETPRYFNPYTGTKFSFINQLLLGEPGMYSTFNQIKEHGGHVLKGHKARKVFFWSMYVPKKDKEEAERLQAEGKSIEHLKQPCLRDYDMFSLEHDTEGLKLDKFRNPLPQTERAEDPTDIIQMVIGDYRVNESVGVREEGGSVPRYNAAEDEVVLPPMRCYTLEEDYYASLLAGFVHSTAREGRDSRKAELEKMLAGETSVREELIAEIGSSMILSACGLNRRETHTQIAAVCQKWTEILEKDYHLLINAAGAAERSARYILGEFAA